MFQHYYKMITKIWKRQKYKLKVLTKKDFYVILAVIE